MKAKILLMAVLLTGALKGAAQNDVPIATLQHGDEVSVFVGVDALVHAHEAASDNDVITLSPGIFNKVVISKSISLYGAGFESNSDQGTDMTEITGLDIGKKGETLANVHIEGVRISGTCYVGRSGNVNLGPVNGLRFVKTLFSNYGYVYSDLTNGNFDQCIVESTFSACPSENTLVCSLLLNNCYLSVCAFCRYHGDSSIKADHCVFNNDRNSFSDVSCSYIVTNSVAVGYAFPSSFVLKNIVSNVRNIGNNVENYYFITDNNVFKDVETGTDGTYSSARTFELWQPDVWIATDGTEIGIRGGNGWSKAPSTPVVKNLQLDVNGSSLNVTYDAIAR